MSCHMQRFLSQPASQQQVGGGESDGSIATARATCDGPRERENMSEMSRGLVACPMNVSQRPSVHIHGYGHTPPKGQANSMSRLPSSPTIYRLGPFYNALAVVKDRDQRVEPKLVSRSSAMGVEGVKKLLQLFSVALRRGGVVGVARSSRKLCEALATC
ncbi:hypothetical protein BDP81DRAFT_221774 [Colletotrichum phormii]|uniref:Uncharacterized protein n=1 Tax=Colletotrichum phormii TaxID=359342 RepID=A0AAI9ZSY1_9PEZI|nr:uncharacterized protein BDP81DRAFT_221774 [Colletotrichum phormii]KAK1637281.1 hypothetical protein BDP81DRAFT_221774 [Colletotrichum phormii]